MKKFFVALATLFTLWSSSVYALDRRMEVINNTSKRVVSLAASPIDQDTWNYNMLSGSYIAPYDSIVADMSDGTGYCRYDLIAELSDGSQAVKYDVNVCKFTSWTINEAQGSGGIRNRNRYE